MDFSIKSGLELTPETIARFMSYDYIRYCVVHGMMSKEKFYGGITNDMDANYSRHKNDEFKGADFNYVSIYQCDDSETAAEVEALLREDGFDCGNTDTLGNGGTETSIYVYLFKEP